jgi:hypothetical protein
MELTAKKLPEDTFNCFINTVNILVCVFNVVLPAIVWIYYVKEEYKASHTAYATE